MGVVTLIALRSRPEGNEPRQPPETPLWLEGIRSQLAPRIPLGTRLVVKAPRCAWPARISTLETAATVQPPTRSARIEVSRRIRILSSLGREGLQARSGRANCATAYCLPPTAYRLLPTA